MNLLTADEIDAALGCVSFGGQLDARKIEAAVIKKLAAGVEPVAELPTDYEGTRYVYLNMFGSQHLAGGAKFYTAEAIAAARVQALEALKDIGTLTTYCSQPNSIFKTFYASATGGDYVDLREFRERIAALLGEAQ